MSFTGIGRIGSQHTLTSTQDDTLYLFNSQMWCTHPLLGNDFMAGNDFDITAGSKVVTGAGGSLFTTLCQNIQDDNTPLNKYIIYYTGSTYGILEVDYVLNDTTLILKHPAFDSGTITTSRASLIDYWGTPILKEVEVLPNLGGSSVTFTVANKFSSNSYTLFDKSFTSSNEGGCEPMLITATSDALTILKY